MSVFFLLGEKNTQAKKGRVFFFPHLPPKVVGVFFPPARPPALILVEIQGNAYETKGFLHFRLKSAPTGLTAGRPPGLEKRGCFFPPPRFLTFWLQKTIDRIIN